MIASVGCEENAQDRARNAEQPSQDPNGPDSNALVHAFV